MISDEEEYERNKIQWRIHVSRRSRQPFLGDALVSFWQRYYQGICADEVNMEVCTSPGSKRGTRRLTSDLGPFKICKEELMATSSHRCWRPDIREPRVGEGWWYCLAHASSARPGAGISVTSHVGSWPRDGLAPSRDFMALLFSKGSFSTRVLCCCSAW